MTERVAQGDNPAIVAPLGLEFQNYLIDPTFTNVNRWFVLLFARNVLSDNRDYFKLLRTKRWN